MSLLRALLALAAALALQTGLGRLWPDGGRIFELLLVPVVWYGVARSQRSAMIIGCAAGLLHDAWFQTAAFGLTGFKWSLIGWALGGLGSRFDLNRQGGRLLAGCCVALADSLLDLVLRALLDLRQTAPGPGELILRSVLTGLLVLASFSLLARARHRRELRRLR